MASWLFCVVLYEPSCQEYGILAFFVLFYVSQVAGRRHLGFFYIVGNPTIGAKKTYPFYDSLIFRIAFSNWL